MVEQTFQLHVTLSGTAEGDVLCLSEPLSLWGGLDPNTGEIIDRHHPASGENVAGKILVMPSGRGSSSASSVLLEAVRQNTAPAGIILAQMDGILVLGLIVAQEIYDVHVPLLVADSDIYPQLQSGQRVRVSSDGVVSIQ